MIAALLFDPDLRMTRAEIASACSGVGEAGNDDLAFLFAEIADSLINRVGIDNSTSSAVNAQHNTADFFVFASLSQPTYDLESRLARHSAAQRAAYRSSIILASLANRPEQVYNANIQNGLLALGRTALQELEIVVESLTQTVSYVRSIESVDLPLAYSPLCRQN